MNTRLPYTLIALLIGTSVVACGDSEEATEARGELITWSEGDLDPFGCAYVTPEPWRSFEEHQALCDEGCTATLAVEKATLQRVFVNCTSADIFIGPGGDMEICLTHPVTRVEHTFSTLAWAAMTELCWAPCDGKQAILPELPDGCFETAP